MKLGLAQTHDQIEFWNRLKPVNRVAATDTYKRTMSASSDIFSNNFTSYNLAARRGIKENGAEGRLVMAGLEKILYPWFMTPISDREIYSAREFFSKNAQMKKFPRIWDRVQERNGWMPIDVWALPGGQTFLAKDGKYVPMMSVEGPGSLVSHLESHLETIFAPVIQATKARLFGSKVVEFGLRSDQLLNNHVTLMLALYVGGIHLTSDDQAVFLFPEYFKDVGTIGHEFLMAYQKANRTLEEAQALAYSDFVSVNDRSSLLPDVIHTIKSGLPAILKEVLKYRGTNKIIGPRFDSGNIAEQCIAWKLMTLDANLEKTGMVIEDGMNPEKSDKIKKEYAQAGFDVNELLFEEEDILTGAGGYFQEGCSRDAISLVYKRSSTKHDDIHEPSMKFSDTPGKESIPGRIRVYEQDDTIVVAQADENIEGVALMQKVIDQGHINYYEDLNVQQKRSENTWNKYKRIVYSEATQAIIANRVAERNLILERM